LCLFDNLNYNDNKEFVKLGENGLF